ncbi:formimidoylglutamate deiminase [Marinicella sediminis]|uniref:Formimidoylglutamate deiminase n=1 Tax=Marinicella sediminis TaxID=1792834 RepID=A0ABV7J9J0_9GAMM|nr:formimidoylglutamate deiminase [Marinicella sediminis]
MNSYFFQSALLPDGWHDRVRVLVEQGQFTAIATGVEPLAGEQQLGVVIPQMPNAHSHVFQRAMAGHSEYRSQQADDFWSWRDLMYRLANEMDDDQLYQVALSCYREMKQAGYLAVCEFHYLHRAKDRPDDYLTHGQILLNAAADAGLNITLLPVLYAFAGVGDQPLGEAQKRFELSVEEYLDYFTQISPQLRPGQQLGICFHSLRAVNQQQMQAVLDGLPDDLPVHIHIAEQTAEVEAIRQHFGMRPVAWLHAHFAVNERWNLVHATHLDESEVRLLARSGAVAVLCPLTEANLGDGIFPMPEYMAHQGRWSVGSDSHIEINPGHELKMLEYSQRLQQHKRNVCCTATQPHVGSWLWLQAVAGGARSHHQPVAGLVVGHKASVIELLPSAQLSPATCLDAWLFADQVTSRVIDFN